MVRVALPSRLPDGPRSRRQHSAQSANGLHQMFFFPVPKKKVKANAWTGADVQPLTSLRDGNYKELERRYGVLSDQLLAYMHYLPSFWMAHSTSLQSPAAPSCRAPPSARPSS